MGPGANNPSYTDEEDDESSTASASSNAPEPVAMAAKAGEVVLPTAPTALAASEAPHVMLVSSYTAIDTALKGVGDALNAIKASEDDDKRVNNSRFGGHRESARKSLQDAQKALNEAVEWATSHNSPH
jgi:hypothetical protein